MNGKLWVIGGRDPSGASLDNTQIYDPATNSWSDGPPLIPARSFADAVTVNREGWGQEPVIVGGYSVGTGSLTSVEASFPACGEPSPTPSPTVTPTATPTATVTATATPTATATATASYADPNAHSYIYSYPDANSDGNGDSNCNTYCDGYGHSDAYANCHAYSDSDT